MTARANVWDAVALSIEGAPNSGRDANDLLHMARGALSLAKEQLDDDQVELQALAGLAKVDAKDGKLRMDLVLPAKDLFDKLHIPCPNDPDAGAN